MKTVRVTSVNGGHTLAEKAEFAGSFLERLVGLMGRPALGEGEGMVISPCASIHTMFMRFPIDAVFYGHDGTVIAAIRALKPYRATRYYGGAAGVVELPTGTLDRIPLSPGDRLEIS